MCGIFGFISHREETYLDRKIFDRCISVLSHRGPDATGTYIGPGFGFSHCAIIDLDPAFKSTIRRRRDGGGDFL